VKHGDPGADINNDPEYSTEGMITTPEKRPMPPWSTLSWYEKLGIGFAGPIVFKLGRYVFRFGFHKAHHTFFTKAFYPEGWRLRHYQLIRHIDKVKGSHKTLGPRLPVWDRYPGPFIMIIIPENYMQEWYGLPEGSSM
jgi:hypothetical protein